MSNGGNGLNLNVLVDKDCSQATVGKMNAPLSLGQLARGAAFYFSRHRHSECAWIRGTGRVGESASNCQVLLQVLNLPYRYHFTPGLGVSRPRQCCVERQLGGGPPLLRNDSMLEAILAKTGDAPSRNSTDVFGSRIAASKPRLQPGVHPD